MTVKEPKPRIGFMYSGLPCAGKTSAAQIGAELTKSTQLDTGDVMRQAAENDGVDSSDSEALSKYGAKVAEESGATFVPERLTGMLLRDELDVKYPLHLAGPRHIDAIREYRKFFTTSCLIMLEAPFELRLERMQARDREGEGRFGEVDLLQRDTRELNKLGTATLRGSDEIDAKIVNDQSLEHLREKVKEILTGYAAYS